MADIGRCDDRASYVSLCVIMAGIVLVIIGCLYPLESSYQIDPSLTAAENESLQEDYTWRRNTLFLVSALGMACLVTGGLITSVLVVRVMCLYKEPGQQGQPAKLSPDWPFTKSQEERAMSPNVSSTGSLSDNKDSLLDADHLQANSANYGSTSTSNGPNH